MANSSGQIIGKKLIENLQSDLRTLSTDCKKKFPPVKESAEAGLLKLRAISTKPDILSGLVQSNLEILHPFILGCDTKNAKIGHMCLTAIQRLITHDAISKDGAEKIIQILWVLLEAGIEELKLLQTAIVLINTSSVVQHENLARILVLCFRLHFSKESVTVNTAAATVRQLISVVFDRVAKEDFTECLVTLPPMSTDVLKAGGSCPPDSLRPAASDAYLTFQDLCLLTNGEPPCWMVGITEMTRTFGLELIESVLTSYQNVFVQHPEFAFLLKERVCPMIIKLFSPSLKFKMGSSGNTPGGASEKPYYPIVIRLLRLCSVLIYSFYEMLMTECEIFLSLLMKFLDPEKPQWQRAGALEVLAKLGSSPSLLRSFCFCYDMKPHSTKIFQDIVNAIGAFIQSQFHTCAQHAQQSSRSAEQAPNTAVIVAGVPVGGVTPQAAFHYRGAWIPIVVNVAGAQGSFKPLFLEQTERSEAPVVPDGYGVSVAFLCLLDIIRSVQQLIDSAKNAPSPTGDAAVDITEEQDGDKGLKQELIISSWCGSLAALALLLDASADETATEAILKSFQIFVSLAGSQNQITARDAFITALCKASLPPHYTLTVLNSPGRGGVTRSMSNSDLPPSASETSQQGSQVVAIGTALPTPTLPQAAQLGNVVLTVKNLHCMRAILNVAHCHGGVLGTAWHLVLTTLQHLVWILGLKPSTGGSLRSGSQTTDSTGAVVTTAAMTDLPVLAAMLSRLFESSQYLDDVALHHLIDALCKLSTEAMELACSNKEPSLFAVAKLLETGLVNLSRVNVLWRPLTAHVLEVCQHPHLGMRNWGAEAVTSLIKAALRHPFDPPLHQQQSLQTMILNPLDELSTIQHSDIRQKQVDCVLSILNTNGEDLHTAWPTILRVIGALNVQGEALVRQAFQCLQLVVTDFLPVMPSSSLCICLDVAAKFGSQHEELNISLTAIGLMWNISDFFYQNRSTLCVSLETNAGASEEISPFDALWMQLFSYLGLLCVDTRPAVRKSAGQTLFSTITAHGDILQQSTWKNVLWKVLFPLLERVKKQSQEASETKENHDANILIHHSRDTAQKQWAETQVLTLAGVARVVNTKRSALHNLDDFSEAWILLLEFIESSALSGNTEVSLAALRSFLEILQLTEDETDGFSHLLNGSGAPLVVPPAAPEDIRIPRSSASDDPPSSPLKRTRPSVAMERRAPAETEEDSALWSAAWTVWLRIGARVTKAPEDSLGSVDRSQLYAPSQAFLTAHLAIFPALYEHLRAIFKADDLGQLCGILRAALVVPINGESTPFVLTAGDSPLSLLQQAVYESLLVLHKEARGSKEAAISSLVPLIFQELLSFVSYSVKTPKYGDLSAKVVTPGKPVQADWVLVCQVSLSELVLKLVVDLYKATAKQPLVIQHNILAQIVENLQVPLGLKYGCPKASTWLLSVQALLSMLQVGLPQARLHVKESVTLWPVLAKCLEAFLFSNHPPPPTRSLDEFQRDEGIDCKIVQLLREDVLSQAHGVPSEFIESVMNILNKGSIHSTHEHAFIDLEASRRVREEFAKSCFETLLQFSFVSTTCTSESSEGAITRLAVSALLSRCKDVLTKFVQDERLSGKCPLPRVRMAEMAFVLKAVSTLLVTLKKAPVKNVEPELWRQVVDLYPALVDCITSQSPMVCGALRDAIREYGDLLAPPYHVPNGV